MKKTILLKVGKFPEVSQSFIVEHATVILNLGYKLKITADIILDFDQSSQVDLLEKYDFKNFVNEMPRAYSVTKKDFIKTILSSIFKLKSIKPLRLLSPFEYGIKALKGEYFFDFSLYKKNQDISLIHVHFGHLLRNIDKIKELGLINSKLVVTFHGIDAHFTQENKNEKSFKYSRLFNVADCITCNTPYLSNQLIKLGCPQEKLKIIHMPVDNEKFKPSHFSKKNETFNILSVGRLTDLKGHKYGIYVVEELLKRGLKVKYTIVGDGEEKNNLIDLITQLRLENNIELVGSKNQNEVVELMQKSDVFLMTSIEDKNGRRETQGIVTGEAQASGLPVVAFNGGGVPFTLIDGKTGFLCPEKDIVEMSNKVEELFKNESLRQTMSANAVIFIDQTFSKKVIQEKWENIYEELLN